MVVLSATVKIANTEIDTFEHIALKGGFVWYYKLHFCRNFHI